MIASFALHFSAAQCLRVVRFFNFNVSLLHLESLEKNSYQVALFQGVRARSEIIIAWVAACKRHETDKHLAAHLRWDHKAALEVTRGT